MSEPTGLTKETVTQSIRRITASANRLLGELRRADASYLAKVRRAKNELEETVRRIAEAVVAEQQTETTPAEVEDNEPR